MKTRLQRPDLVVPYIKVPFRYRAIPYLVAGVIIVATVIAMVVINMKGVQ